jgi:hypothetical protein
VEGLLMTKNGNFKRRVRARAAKTGESYTAALKHIRHDPPDDRTDESKSVRLAVAQISACDDPRNARELRESGRTLRQLMFQAREAGARIVHFPEGATCSPNKRIMSVAGPAEVGPSDWDQFEWAVLRENSTRREGLHENLNSGRSSVQYISSLAHTGRTTAFILFPIRGTW